MVSSKVSDIAFLKNYHSNPAVRVISESAINLAAGQAVDWIMASYFEDRGAQDESGQSQVALVTEGQSSQAGNQRPDG